MENLVDINTIKVPMLFHKNPVSEKLIRKIGLYYQINGTLDKPIALHSREDNLLIDGYGRYVFAQSKNLKQVPVSYSS